MGVSSGVGTDDHSRAPEFITNFSEVRVARSLVFCVVLCILLLVLLLFFIWLAIVLSVLLHLFGHCVVCPSSFVWSLCCLSFFICLAIALSVLLRVTDSDYPFVITKLFSFTLFLFQWKQVVFVPIPGLFIELCEYVYFLLHWCIVLSLISWSLFSLLLINHYTVFVSVVRYMLIHLYIVFIMLYATLNLCS